MWRGMEIRGSGGERIDRPMLAQIQQSLPMLQPGNGPRQPTPADSACSKHHRSSPAPKRKHTQLNHHPRRRHVPPTAHVSICPVLAESSTSVRHTVLYNSTLDHPKTPTSLLCKPPPCLHSSLHLRPQPESNTACRAVESFVCVPVRRDDTVCAEAGVGNSRSREEVQYSYPLLRNPQHTAVANCILRSLAQALASAVANPRCPPQTQYPRLHDRPASPRASPLPRRSLSQA